ncbi:DUF5993 family protein [Edwardsiella ictaluri]|uniref:Uncharacterized protein n=3 Tax=Edwardsiella ictaluri TaxID=67780 RepID=C5BD06_EDWI9|nr:DUF5993 family protein [Edwardsiella ictaluri]ACR68324.1 hypothetical protein NT01EI_1113 [Edwardsiella ictaluri 93-146]UCQ48684.1 DUF5993 family protein [Edwardsiella ictaluri]UCQ51939.1 DUF5993 family protein [Edwardsiella ictaluri]UYB62628.1 DUF5993 family protein [Edwardsiella ictaluri]UYB65854.1 DUF5993 family protein [Edwardsiella ictaluri]
MYMFLPFLIAFGTVLSTIAGKKKLTYILWLILVVITLFWFKHHAINTLTLSF